MDKVRISIWLGILIIIMILFNLSFRMVYTPAGRMGEISAANTIASSIYLVAWLVLALIAGRKKRKELVVAAVIYSALPLLGFIGGILSGTPFVILIMFLFYWSVPIQGVFIGNEQLIGNGTVVLQPLILSIGYFLSQMLEFERKSV